AGIAEFARHSVSRRISFWRDADERVDVAALHYRGERTVWRGIAAFCPAGDDERRKTRNDLRRNRKCAGAAARRNGTRGGGALRSAGHRQIFERGSAACRRIQRGTRDFRDGRRRGGDGRDGNDCAAGGRTRAAAKLLFERNEAVSFAAEGAWSAAGQCG